MHDIPTHARTRERTGTQTRRAVLRGTLTTAAVAGGLTTASGPALADDTDADADDADEGFFDGNLIIGDDSARANTLAVGRGWAGRQAATVFNTLDPSESDEIAAELREQFNDHSDEFRAWINDRDLGGSQREVFELEIAADGESSTLYLVADYDTDDDAYASAEVLDAETFDDEYDTEPDETARLESTAAREAPAELERFYEEFVEPDEDVSSSYITELTTKYGGGRHISSTLLGDDL